MVRVNSEIAAAIEASDGEPVKVEVPGSEEPYVIVSARQLEALRQERDYEAISVGIEQMEAGKGRPAEEVFDDLRAELLRRKAEVESASHNSTTR